MKGIVYLVQPKQYINTNVYKIGYSSKTNLSRCYSYGAGSECIYVMNCLNPTIVEKKIIEAFKKNFELVIGREYFCGERTRIESVFLEVVMKQISNESDKSSINSPDNETNFMNNSGVVFNNDSTVATDTINPVANTSIIINQNLNANPAEAVVVTRNFGRKCFNCKECDYSTIDKSNYNKHLNFYAFHF